MQWHPEVNRFQWKRGMNFPHSRHAVRLSSLLAEFFINEGNPYWKEATLLRESSLIFLPWFLGRRSLHHFEDPEEEASSLIYKYNPIYAANITGYQQIYFF